MNYGLDLQTSGGYADPQLLVEIGIEAEAAGWDGLFVWDVIYAENNPHQPVVDPWVVLSAIAARTRRIRLGAMVTPLARRRPWIVARQTATLDLLSQGRLIFGAGLGYQDLDFAPFGEAVDSFERGARLDEALQVVSGLWRGDAYQFSGEHYQVNVEAFLPTPMQRPRPPIWVAGYWPNRRPFRRAARWDGAYIGAVRAGGGFVTQADVRDCIAYIQSQRSDPGPFEIAFSSGPPDADKSYPEFVRSFGQAGVTWWLEGIGDYIDSLPVLRERIRSGPLRVES